MAYTESELIEEATKRGYLNARLIRPAHLLLHSNCPELVVPEDAKLFYSGGWLYYMSGNNTNFKDQKYSDSSYCALIYHTTSSRTSWAEIVESRGTGYTFPSEGVCWEPNYELIEYLKNRPDDSGNSQHVSITKGVAWNRTSYWGVSTSSGKPKFTIKELVRHIPHIVPEQLSHRPLTPEECFETLKPKEPYVPFSVRNDFRLPDRWCIAGTEGNKDMLNEFIHSNKEAWKNYRSSWTNYGLGSILHYPPPEGIVGHSLTSVEKGYTEITTEQFIKHVLTHTDKQITNNLNLQENDGSRPQQSRPSEHSSGVAIKVQRSDLSVRGREPARGVGLKCNDFQIKVGSGHLPN